MLVFRSHWGEEFSRGVERMAETREVMDIREASEYLGVSRETLYKYAYEEKIPAFKLGNRWKFKKRSWTVGWRCKARNLIMVPRGSNA